MAEGEVSVSLGGIVAPLLVGGLAATVLTWRFAFVAGGAIVTAAVLAMGAVRIPGLAPSSSPPRRAESRAHRFLPTPTPTLVVVFAVVALEFSLSFWLASYLNDSVRISRGLAVIMVSGLHAANLAGRLLASRLARHTTTECLLGASLTVGLVGLPVLLTAGDAAVAAIAISVTGVGVGVGAMFPLTSSLHVGVSSRNADNAIGRVLLQTPDAEVSIARIWARQALPPERDQHRPAAGPTVAWPRQAVVGPAPASPRRPAQGSKQAFSTDVVFLLLASSGSLPQVEGSPGMPAIRARCQPDDLQDPRPASARLPAERGELVV